MNDIKTFFADMHCDTASKIYTKNIELYENNGHIDIKRLMKYESPVQFFAMWLSPKYYGSGFKKTCEYIDYFKNEVEKNSKYIDIAKNYSDILKYSCQGKISAVMTLEGAEAFDDDIENIYKLYDMGIRAAALTWNYSNSFASGCIETKPVGLTRKGQEAIKIMEKLGIIIDVSHCSEQTFWDIYNISEKPFIASHSNSKSICGHTRNLSDEQIKAIAEKNGVIGINIYPPFLSKSETVDISCIKHHIDHIIKIVGDDYIGLGFDLDGIENCPKGFKGIEDIDIVSNILSSSYKSNTVEKIMGGNCIRVIKNILK